MHPSIFCNLSEARVLKNRIHLQTAIYLLLFFCLNIGASNVFGQDKPIKVFVLVGQSNMQGHAKIETLPHLGMDPKTKPMLDLILNESGNTKTISDTYISHLSKDRNTSGLMGVGQGADENKIGPELTFAAYMQKHLGQQILIIKCAWGGKSLHTDFRPPSAGPYEFEQSVLDRLKSQGKEIEKIKAERKKATGAYYKKTVEHVNKVLAELDSYVTGYDNSKGYDLAGIVWFQGWNDMVDSSVYPNRGNDGGYDDYTKVLRHFIRDIRKDLNAPDLPFVIGVMGVGGPTDKYGPDQARYKKIHQNFRDAMAAPAKEDEFKDNVVAVLTENYWDQELDAAIAKNNRIKGELRKLQKEGKLQKSDWQAKFDERQSNELTEREREIIRVGVSNQAYHYLGSGKIIAQIGKGFAEALIELKKRDEPRPPVKSSDKPKKKVRVFIFAGQSNMVGADSKVSDIKNFPPFKGLDQPQETVRFAYCIGRENKRKSEGWKSLKPVGNMVGPELSFARKVSKSVEEEIAIIKVAAGGTHLGGDWNPDEPSGFKLYPLALKTVKDAIRQLSDQGCAPQIDGFMWHQGENDMFDEKFMANYGANLENFVSKWRTDLEVPDLKFFVGELCTKTIWGMDLRPRMHAISVGQKKVANADPLVYYIPTSHVGVEIGGGVGLHYHYGTLGQLEHGVNYADAWLASSDLKKSEPNQNLKEWPFSAGSTVKLLVLAGHRNMEGERAFVQELAGGKDAELLKPNPKIPFKYSIGGGYKKSDGWEPLRPAGYYDTFGPELSFGRWVKKHLHGENFAIAKFTHSGSQIVDWTPEGSVAKTRNLYPDFIEFVKASKKELEEKGHDVVVDGIFYHVGENDMSFGPFRKKAAENVKALIKQSRLDLELPKLQWHISQQPPTDHKQVNKINVLNQFLALEDADPNTHHVKIFSRLGREKQLVISTQGIVNLGKRLGVSYLKQQK